MCRREGGILQDIAKILEEGEVIYRQEEEVMMMIGIDIIIKMKSTVVNLGTTTQKEDKTMIIRTQKENAMIFQVMIEIENSRGGGRLKKTLL